MITTTSKGRTQRLVYSGDPAVQARPEALAARRAVWERRQVLAVLADLPKGTGDEARLAAEQKATAEVKAAAAPKVWLPVDECSSTEGATVAQVRGLNWLEDQEAQALPADKQILRVLELGLVDLDGSIEAAKAFLADPRAELVIPLYRAVCDLTWGN